MNFFRRKPFPAKPAGEPTPTVDPIEPEFMTPRVDVETIPVSVSMQELAAAIIRNPAFDMLARRLRSDQLNLLLSTRPDEKDARERCYLRISALDDIVVALGALGIPDSKVHQTRTTKR